MVLGGQISRDGGISLDAGYLAPGWPASGRLGLTGLGGRLRGSAGDSAGKVEGVGRTGELDNPEIEEELFKFQNCCPRGLKAGEECGPMVWA